MRYNILTFTLLTFMCEIRRRIKDKEIFER